MRIGLDFDNVLANTTGAVLKYIHKKYDRIYYVEDIKKYDFNEIVGLSNKELWDCFLAVWTTHQLLEPMDHFAPYYIKQMQQMGNEVLVITAAGLQIVEEWLKYWHYPDLSVIYIGNGGNKKTEYELDILVDDKPSHIREFNEHCVDGKKCWGIIYDRPWNDIEDFEEWFNIPRAENFREIADYIRVMSGIRK